MFEKLKRRSLRKITERHVMNRDLSKVNDPVKTVGFLVDEKISKEFETFYDFYSDLELVPKDIKVFSFIEAKKKLPSLRQNQVQCKDFNWKGEMHNQNAKEFVQRDFDLLIGYYNDKNAFLDAMISQSNAKFKVGFVGADERLFDLLIAVDAKNVKLFKQELIKYLKILKKI